MRAFLSTLCAAVTLSLLCGSAVAGPSYAEEMARLGLTETSLSELAGEVSDLVFEIHQGRKLAREAGAKLVTYGGTSREILDYVIEKVRAHGGVAAYRKELASRRAKGEWIELFDFHRIASDLDLMLIPEKSGVDYRKLVERIQVEFPGDLFYKKFDIHVADEFFKEYPLESNHVESISNLPISERGVEKISELMLTIDRHKVNLAEQGLSQYVTGRLEFRLSPRFYADKAYREQGAFRHLLSVLRWMRYLSENPGMTFSEKSESAISDLLGYLLTHQREETLELLKKGHAGLLDREDGRGPAAKLVASLEKLQLYSRDSEKTNALLHRKFPIHDPTGEVKGIFPAASIADMAEEAGIAKARLFETLPSTSDSPQILHETDHPGEKLLADTVFFHRSSLNAIQNIGRGALWASNNETIVAGRTTRSVLTERAKEGAFYVSTLGGATGYGDFFVPVTLAAGAIEGRDFVRKGEWIAVLNRSVIKSVHQPTLAELKAHVIRIVSSGNAERREHMSLVRTLGAILSPRHEGDRELALKLATGFPFPKEQPANQTAAGQFLKAFFSKPSNVQWVEASKDRSADKLLALMAEFALSHENESTLLDVLAHVMDLSTSLGRKRFEALFPNDADPNAAHELFRRLFVSKASAGALRTLPELTADMFVHRLESVLKDSRTGSYRMTEVARHFDPKTAFGRAVLREYLKAPEKKKDRKLADSLAVSLAAYTSHPDWVFTSQDPEALSVRKKLAECLHFLHPESPYFAAPGGEAEAKEFWERWRKMVAERYSDWIDALNLGHRLDADYFAHKEEYEKAFGMGREFNTLVWVNPSPKEREPFVKADYGVATESAEALITKIRDGVPLEEAELRRLKWLVQHHTAADYERKRLTLPEYLITLGGKYRGLSLAWLSENPKLTMEEVGRMLLGGPVEPGVVLREALLKNEAWRTAVRNHLFDPESVWHLLSTDKWNREGNQHILDDFPWKPEVDVPWLALLLEAIKHHRASYAFEAALPLLNATLARLSSATAPTDCRAAEAKLAPKD